MQQRCFFRVIGSSLGVHTPEDFVGFIAVPLNLFEMAFSSFRDLSNGCDTAFRGGLNFHEPSKSQDAGDGDNDTEECEDNGNDSKPAVDIRRPIIQKRSPCWDSSSANSASTACWISCCAPTRNSSVTGSPIVSRPSGPFTLLLLTVAYLLCLL